MAHVDTPWIGLAALVAMFVLPFLPSWLFEGPRTIKHRPRRHVCADCGAPWTRGHACALDEPDGTRDTRPLRGRLERVTPSRALVRRPRRSRKSVSPNRDDESAMIVTVAAAVRTPTIGCVEVALVEGGAAVRDSKDPASPVLRFTAREWEAFLARS